MPYSFIKPFGTIKLALQKMIKEPHFQYLGLLAKKILENIVQLEASRDYNSRKVT